MIKFSCSNCGHNYRVPEDYAGKKVRCKNCNSANIVPAAVQKTANAGDSLANYNNLLEELCKYEKSAPPAEEIESEA